MLYASHSIIAHFVIEGKLGLASKQVCLDSTLLHSPVVRIPFVNLSSAFSVLIGCVAVALRLCSLFIGRYQKALL